MRNGEIPETTILILRQKEELKLFFETAALT